MNRQLRAPVARYRPSWRGFTLVEILIVVVIIGILATIAIPSYSAFVRKARRTDATAFLSEAAGEQMRFFSENNTYATDLATLGYDDGYTDDGYYSVTVTGATTNFSLTATVVSTGLQSTDTDCASFTITSTGAMTAARSDGTTNPACW